MSFEVPRLMAPDGSLQPGEGAEQTMAMPNVQRHWRAADVRALMDESRHWPRYELIDGELLVTPAPGNRHQLAIAELVSLLKDYVDRLELGAVFLSPADLELVAETIVQPDVFVVPRSPDPDRPLTDGWTQVKSLLLAVEVISPSSMRTDRVTKRDFYLGAGVPEYWVMDLDARVIERWTPVHENPTIARDVLSWQPEGASDALRLDVAALFDELWRKIRLVRV